MDNSPKIELFKTYPAMIAVIKVEAPSNATQEDVKKLALDYIKENKTLGALFEKMTVRTTLSKIPLQGFPIWFIKFELTSADK